MQNMSSGLLSKRSMSIPDSDTRQTLLRAVKKESNTITRGECETIPSAFWKILQVKQIMEEAVTRKFVHEESSSITSLCGAVEACLLHGLRKRALGLFKFSNTTALLQKVSKSFEPALQVVRLVNEIETNNDPPRKSLDTNKNQTKRQTSISFSPKYLWLRVAIFEKQLAKILDYLVQNNSKYYESWALISDPVDGPILASLLVGPCALDYTKMKTSDHFWTDPPADELVQRHRIHSGGHHMTSGAGSPGSPRRPGLQKVPHRANVLGIRRNASSSSEESSKNIHISAREYVESLHQNSRSTLLYGKNNVLVQPKEGVEALQGYLSLHQTVDGLTIMWTPNQLMNGCCEETDEDLDRRDDRCPRCLVESLKTSPTGTKPSHYWDFALTIFLDEIVYIHCHQQPDCRGTIVLVGQDGVQRPPIHFPKGGHLLAFLSCLETGLLPHGQLDPPLWSQRGKAEMALRLTAVNRWCVSGTPIQKSVEDIYGLLLFLGVDPYWVQPWWNKLIYEPFCYGVTEPMYELLTTVMWRTMKIDVLDQINIPEQTEEMNWLTFSPVEEHFYRRQYRDCVRMSMERLGKWTDSSTRLSSLDRHTVNQLLYPLLRLRQACCHPQAVRGEFLPIQKTTMTMEELLESLTKKAKLEAEESHRLLIAAINGQAGLCIIQEQFVDAVDRYREVLRSIEEQKDSLHTDKLQQLHAMYNLNEILQSKPDGVAPTLRDDQLQTQIQELKDTYMAKAIAYVKETGDALNTVQFEVKQLQRELHEGSEWWLDIILWAIQRDQDETLVIRIKDDLLENTDNQLKTPLRSCRNSTGLQYVMHHQLSGIDSAYQQVLKVMKELQGEPSQDLINKTVECCLRPIAEVLKNCPFCKSEELFETYESKLFFFVERGVEVGGIDQGYSVNVNRQGTWADSEAEKALKTILGFAKGCRVDPELIEHGNTHIKLLDAMKKEYKKLRTHWAGIKEHVASFDELDMSTTRLRLRLPDEPVPDTPQLNVLEKSELTQHKLKLASDRIVAQGELRKKLGQLLYLKNLAKTQCGSEDGDNPELCPICQQELGKEWSVMQCGHCFCLECIRILVDRASFGRRNFSVKCAVCRQSTHQGEISYVTTKRKNDAGDGMDVWVKGSHSTKVEAVVRCLLKIKREDPKAKVLVFSTWTDVLSVIASALDENSVSYKSLYTAGKFQQNLFAFKQSDEGTTLLLPVHSGANGLNLIEATHVILVEPILNPAQELQAIGRVHRIGQTRPTKVHRFLIRGTIEQKMHVLIKSLDTHGLSKNSEDSVLTIGDLSALFSQQTEEDTELTENLQHTHVVSDQSAEHQSTGNNVLVEQNDHVSRSDELPSTSDESLMHRQDHVTTSANEMPSTSDESLIHRQDHVTTSANEMPSTSDENLIHRQDHVTTSANEIPSTSYESLIHRQDHVTTSANEMPGTSDENLIHRQDHVTTSANEMPSTSKEVLVHDEEEDNHVITTDKLQPEKPH